VCPQPSRALPPLAFSSNAGAEDQRQAQANCKMMPQHVFLRPLKPVIQAANKSFRYSALVTDTAPFCNAQSLLVKRDASILSVNATPKPKTWRNRTDDAR
jgi:hypothetical protein